MIGQRCEQYNDFARCERQPKRDIDSLRAKFDKLANTKKPTGDPSCPDNMQQAKQIAKIILERCKAVVTSESEIGETTGSANKKRKNGDQPIGVK